MDNSAQLELIYDYKLKEVNLDSINKYYNINMSKNNLIASSYITYDDDKNTIVGSELTYSYNNKNIKVNISDNLENLNVLTNGLINVLNNSEKSIINEKQIVLAKFKDDEYPKYIMYEHENNKDYYFALYIKYNLYYYITSNDINEEEFIEFLNDIIL